MPLANYSEIRATIARRLKDPDLIPEIPDYMAIAQIAINNDLRVPAMEYIATATVASGSTNVAVPTGYIAMRRLQLNLSPIVVLKQVSPAQFSEYAVSTTGRPVLFAVIGEAVYFKPTLDIAYTVEMTYYKKLDAVDNSTATNWVTTNAPELIIYRSMFEATLENKYLDMYKGRIAELNDVGREGRWSSAPMHIKAV